MNENAKLTNVLLVVLIIAVVGVGYVLMKKQTAYVPMSFDQNAYQQPIKQTQQVQTSTTGSAISPNWNQYTKAQLGTIVSGSNPDLYYEKDYGLTLSQTVDFNGDGATEAVVTGNGGNNDVSFILMRNGDGVIRPTSMRLKDGTITPVALYQIGRVQVNENFKLLPAEHGFYTASLSLDESSEYSMGSNFVCRQDSVNGYQWDSQIGLFAWSQALTAKYTAQVCNS
jgi:hypothetical protein